MTISIDADTARARLERAIHAQYLEELGTEPLSLGQLLQVTGRSREWAIRRIWNGTITATFDGVRHHIPIHENRHVFTETGIRLLPRRSASIGKDTREARG